MDINLLKETIGRRLKQARKECDLTQDEVAERLGLTSVGYGSFERGTNLIALNYLIEVSRILDKPLTYFLPSPYVSPEELNDITHDPQFHAFIETWRLLTELADMGDEAGRNAKTALRLQAQAYKNLAEERLKRKKAQE